METANVMGYFITGITCYKLLLVLESGGLSAACFQVSTEAAASKVKLNKKHGESELLNTGKYKPTMKHQVKPNVVNSLQALFNPVVIVESDWERRDLVSSSSVVSSKMLLKQQCRG